MKRRTEILGLVATAFLVSSFGVQAQVPSQEGVLFGVDPVDPIFTLFPATTDTNYLSQSTSDGSGPVLSPLAPGPLPTAKRQGHGTWSRILIGAGIGLFAGFGLGWAIDVPEDCPV